MGNQSGGALSSSEQFALKTSGRESRLPTMRLLMRILPYPKPSESRADQAVTQALAREPSTQRWISLLSTLSVPHASWQPAERANTVRMLAEAHDAAMTDGRTFLRMGDGSVELCIDRRGESTLYSAYDVGAVPRVYAYEVDPAPKARRSTRGKHTPHTVSTGARNHGEISAICMLREAAGERAARGAEFADLQAVLFEGSTGLQIAECQWASAQCRPFLVSEGLIGSAESVLDAVERGVGRSILVEFGDMTLQLRVSRTGGLAMRATSESGMPTDLAPWQTVSSDVWVSLCARFARRISALLAKVRPAQARNLRVTRLRRRARIASVRAKLLFRTESVVNDRPDDYRPNAGAAPSLARATERSSESFSLTPRRLSYTERWRALVPSMDLRGTFVAGEKLVLSSATETYALDRSTGELVWRTRLPRGMSIATPRGLIRQASDGQVVVVDVETGKVKLRTWLAPRTARSGIALAVSGGGAPPQLLLSEGDRDVVSLDLITGEPRWRYRCARGKVVRARRLGKLVYLTDTRNTVTALDVQTGQMVWRRRDSLGFHHAPTLSGDTMYVVAGAENTRGKLCALDAYSGDLRWQSEWEVTPSSLDAAPVVHGNYVSVPMRVREGVQLRCHRTDTGELQHLRGTSMFAPGSSWTNVDAMLIVHEATGRLVGVDPRAGGVAYASKLGTTHASDVPRRLEPVLRAGVLFVPHSNVHIIDPMTGRQIADLPSPDAIPDLIRVDERCNVYVAEESGHVVAFGVSNQLGLVAVNH